MLCAAAQGEDASNQLAGVTQSEYTNTSPANPGTDSVIPDVCRALASH